MMNETKEVKPLIAMAYNQFWDNFNWELYQRVIYIKLNFK